MLNPNAVPVFELDDTTALPKRYRQGSRAPHKGTYFLCMANLLGDVMVMHRPLRPMEQNEPFPDVPSDPNAVWLRVLNV